MSEEFLAINHIQRKFGTLYAVHGATLAAVQVTGQAANLLVANPQGAAAQTLSGSLTITGTATINGNLVVNGSTTTVNSTMVDITDRLIHLNNTTGANDPVPTLLSGFAIHRGSVNGTPREHAGVVWDESAQAFTLAFTAADDSGYGTGGHVLLKAKQILVDADPTNPLAVASKQYVDSVIASGGGTQLLGANNAWTGTNTWSNTSTFTGPVNITGAPAYIKLNNSYIWATNTNPGVVNIGSSLAGTPTMVVDTTSNAVTVASGATVSLPASTTIGGASGAGSSVTLGPLEVINPSSANVYPFPYSGKGGIIFAGGVPQIQGSDYVDNGNGTFSFTPALPSPTPEVTGTAVASGTATGAASHFVEQLGDGTTTAFTMPGSAQEEIVMIGRGYLAKRGTQAGGAASGDYYVSGTQIHFFTAPSANQSIMISCAVATIAGSDAVTLGGHPLSDFVLTSGGGAAPDSTKLGGQPASYYASAASVSALSAAQGNPKPFARLTIEGDLSTIPAGSMPVSISPPFLNSGATRTISKIVIYCPQSGTGTINLDVMSQAVGGAASSMYATNAGSKPTLTGNGGLAATVITGANLPSTLTLADLTAIFPKLLTQPNNSWNDLVVEFYE